MLAWVSSMELMLSLYSEISSLLLLTRDSTSAWNSSTVCRFSSKDAESSSISYLSREASSEYFPLSSQARSYSALRSCNSLYCALVVAVIWETSSLEFCSMATRAVPAETTAVMPMASHPAGPRAALAFCRARENDARAGFATFTAKVTAVIPVTTVPNPTPNAVITFVTAGYSVRKFPMPSTNPAAALDAFSSAGVTELPKAVLMAFPAFCQWSLMDWAF